MIKRWRYRLAGIVLVGFVLLLFSWTAQLAEHGAHQMVIEREAMFQLSVLAQQMIAEKHAGVATDDNGPYIQTFGAFYSYVAKKRPEAVSSIHSPNPFPGILTEKEYRRLQGESHSGKDPLLGCLPFTRPIGQVTYTLQCDGTIDIRIKK